MNDKIVFSDFYGTLSKGRISSEFLDFLYERKLYHEDFYPVQKSLVKRYNEGNISYNDYMLIWGELWAGGLKGRNSEDITSAAKEFYPSFKDSIYPFAFEVMQIFKEKNHELVLVSAGAHEVVSLAAKDLGMDGLLATKCEIKKGKYTGDIITKLHLPKGKEDAITDYVHKNKLSLSNSLAMGDSEHDKCMLEVVPHQIVINPTDSFAIYAKRRFWKVLTQDNVVEYVRSLE
ncbi:HAD family phosphatase [Candidatus Woesearchaeota archaeon]|nr:HAD family phosphatase [Candidatus Woesearchaeota archaeon]